MMRLTECFCVFPAQSPLLLSQRRELQQEQLLLSLTSHFSDSRTDSALPESGEATARARSQQLQLG